MPPVLSVEPARLCPSVVPGPLAGPVLTPATPLLVRLPATPCSNRLLPLPAVVRSASPAHLGGLSPSSSVAPVVRAVAVTADAAAPGALALMPSVLCPSRAHARDRLSAGGGRRLFPALRSCAPPGLHLGTGDAPATVSSSSPPACRPASGARPACRPSARGAKLSHGPLPRREGVGGGSKSSRLRPVPRTPPVTRGVRG